MVNLKFQQIIDKNHLLKRTIFYSFLRFTIINFLLNFVKKIKIMKKLLYSFFALIILFSFSCKEDPTSGQVEVNLVHKIGTENVEKDDIKYDSPAGHKYSVTTLKYFLSHIQLLKSGDDFELQKYYYVDIDDSNTLRFNISNVAPGKYNQLKLTFGIPRTENIVENLPNSVEVQNMAWPTPLKSTDISPSGDFHYQKYEGRYDSLNTGNISSFAIHLGPTKGNDNSFDVILDMDEVEVDGNEWSIDLNIDLNEWLKSPEIYNFYQFGPMIMPNQTAQEYLKANGSTVFSVGKVTQK